MKNTPSQLYTDFLEIQNLIWLYLGQEGPIKEAPIPYVIDEKKPANIATPIATKNIQAPIQETPKKEIALPKEPVIQQEVVEEKTHSPDAELLIHKRKKLEKIFPRPYKPLTSLLEFENIRKIEIEAKITLKKEKALFPKEQHSSIPTKWKIVSLIHQTNSSPLHDFISAFSKAIQEKLSIDIGGDISSFSDIKKDLIQTLSLADGKFTLFIGEDHLLSSLQQFLQDLNGFQTISKTQFSPCIYLGTYFETICLFLPIDETRIKEPLFKRNIWQCMQKLQE